MNDDPLDKIEMQNSMYNIGTCAHYIYKGAIDEGATQFEAYLILCGWFVGQFSSKPDHDEDES